jgi:hypothetical protein
MIDFIELDRFWRVNEEVGFGSRGQTHALHNMVEVKVLKILKQANRIVKYVILG